MSALGYVSRQLKALKHFASRRHDGTSKVASYAPEELTLNSATKSETKQYDIETLLNTRVGLQSEVFGEDEATVGQVLYALRVGAVQYDSLPDSVRVLVREASRNYRPRG